MTRRVFLLCLFGSICFKMDVSVGASEAAWPQFRGVNAAGVLEKGNPPWKIGPETGVSWKIEVPWSPSSPVVWGEKIFLTTTDGGQLQTCAYDRANGRQLWKKEVIPSGVEEFHRLDGSPAASTPATDGTHVVSYFGSFGLVCYDLNGKEIWRYPLPVAKSAGKFGTGTSPVIVNHTLLLSRDDPAQSKLLALDIRSGKLLWEAPRTDLYGSFGTPILWRNDGFEEVILPGSLKLKAYSLKTGKERWEVGGLCSFTCTTAVVGDGNLYYGAFAPGGGDNPWPEWSVFRSQFETDANGDIVLSKLNEVRRDYVRALDLNDDGKISEKDWIALRSKSSKGVNQLIAVKPGGKGDITESHVSWIHKKGLPYVPSPLFYEGRIYFVKDGGLLSSLNAENGKPFYLQERLKARGSYYASPVAAAGKIYLASLEGKLTVVKAGGDLPEVLHEADFGERILATPAFAGDNIFLRTQTQLFAFGQ